MSAATAAQLEGIGEQRLSLMSSSRPDYKRAPCPEPGAFAGAFLFEDFRKSGTI